MTSGNENPDGKPEGEDKGKPKDDIDALRKTYDEKLAEQAKELKSVSQTLAERELQVQDLMERVEQAQGQIQLDDDASPETKAAVKKMEDELAQARQGVRMTFAHWAEAASLSEARALALEFDVPDQVDSLSREFHKVATKEGKKGLDLAVKEAKIRLQSDAAEKKTKAKGKPEGEQRQYDDNVQSGRPSPNVVDQMNEIDIHTPEGQADWAKQRAKIAKTIGVPLP